MGSGLARTIALYGGEPQVGKTAAAANLAVLLARSGRHVCFAHLDEGWPAATWFDVPPMAGYVAQARERLDLALWRVEDDPFDDAVAAVAADILLIDVPSRPESVAPELLRVADEVVLVARESKDTLGRVARDLGVVTDLLAERDVDLQVQGLLLTLADRSLESFERLLVQAERHFPLEVFPYCIPRAEGAEEGDHLVVESAGTGRRARAYVELAMEVLDHGG